MYKREDYTLMFPEHIKYKINEYVKEGIQEIRVKANKPIILYLKRGEVILNYTTSVEDIRYILKNISSLNLRITREV